MRYWIARAAIEAREDAGRIQSQMAAELRVDQSTIARFEGPANPQRKANKVGWPRDLDETVAAYARDLEMDPRELWLRALILWMENESPNVELAARMVAAVREASRSSDSQTQGKQPAKGKRPATG